jgi:hypothetical protein
MTLLPGNEDDNPGGREGGDDDDNPVSTSDDGGNALSRSAASTPAAAAEAAEAPRRDSPVKKLTGALKVRRCRLTVPKPVSTAPYVAGYETIVS